MRSELLRGDNLKTLQSRVNAFVGCKEIEGGHDFDIKWGPVVVVRDKPVFTVMVTFEEVSYL